MCNTNPFEGMDAYCIYAIRGKSQRLARQAYFSLSDIDDIESDLAMHLRQQLGRYDPNRGSFRTFVSRVLDHKIMSMIAERRTRHFDHQALSLELSAEATEAHADTTSLDVMPQRVDGQPLDFSANAVLRADLRTAMRVLTPQQIILCRLLAEDRNMTESARAMGISRDTAYELKRQIQHKFRRLGLDAHLLR
jgi:RNA polymerase sigma factor (sigma-70 family)